MIKPLATIHFAKQAPKRKIGPFGIRFGRLCASKPCCFCPRDKNETAGSRFRNSLRICPRACPKRLSEDTRRDSAARWTKPTTELAPIGMAPQQTSVKEWELQKLASELAFWCCRVPPDTVSASPQDEATSEIVGITALEPSGSRAFFLHLYLGKRPNYSRLSLLGGTAEYLAVRE